MINSEDHRMMEVLYMLKKEIEDINVYGDEITQPWHMQDAAVNIVQNTIEEVKNNMKFYTGAESDEEFCNMLCGSPEHDEMTVQEAIRILSGHKQVEEDWNIPENAEVIQALDLAIDILNKVMLDV